MLGAADSAARVTELDRRVNDIARVGPATLITRKRNTSNDTEYNMVELSPVILHREAGLDRDTYAVARCISSEVDTKGPGATLLAIAECLRNAAREEETGAYQICAWRTVPSYEWTKGFYGEQHGRKVSTARDPVARGVLAARMALQEETNYWNGARRWFDPRVQDGGKQGIRDLEYDAVGIASKWGSEGWQWVGHAPNVNPYSLAVLKHVGKPVTNADLIAVIRASRDGANMTPIPKAPEPIVSQTTDPDVKQEIDKANTVAKRGFPWWLIVGGFVGYTLVS